MILISAGIQPQSTIWTFLIFLCYIGSGISCCRFSCFVFTVWRISRCVRSGREPLVTIWALCIRITASTGRTAVRRSAVTGSVIRLNTIHISISLFLCIMSGIFGRTIRIRCSTETLITIRTSLSGRTVCRCIVLICISFIWLNGSFFLGLRSGRLLGGRSSGLPFCLFFGDLFSFCLGLCFCLCFCFSLCLCGYRLATAARQQQSRTDCQKKHELPCLFHINLFSPLIQYVLV